MPLLNIDYTAMLYAFGIIKKFRWSWVNHICALILTLMSMDIGPTANIDTAKQNFDIIVDEKAVIARVNMVVWNIGTGF